jgi:pilus assembly protein CpaC
MASQVEGFAWRVVSGCLFAATLFVGQAYCQTYEYAYAASEAEVLNQDDEFLALDLPLNKSRIIKLPTPVREILVTNPDIAEVVIKSPRQVYLLGQAVGDTNAFFFDEAGRQVARIELRVELDLTPLRTALKSLMPDEDVAVSAVNEHIVLTGNVRSPAAAENARLIARRFTESDEEIVNMLSLLGEQQVLVRVRVSEMQRAIVKQLGVNTRLLFNVGNVFTDGTFTGRFVDNTAPPLDTFGLAAATFTSGATMVSALIDALERDGLIKSLAEPNLTAVSGEDARVLVGGEFPIPVAQDNDTITIEFKEFGIGLTFTPVVLDSGLISLRISTEVSQLSTEGQIALGQIIIPALNVRRAETTVELPSGGSMVIAGLLQNDINNTIDGVPGIKDIPVLGALFRSVNFQRNETELVVSVTPYLVRPVDDPDIRLPTDGFSPASDVDLYLLGRLHGVYAGAGELPTDSTLRGPVGYIME